MGPVLQKHQRGLFDEFFDLCEKLRRDCSIDHSVVTGESEIHSQAGNDLAVLDDGFFNGGSY